MKKIFIVVIFLFIFGEIIRIDLGNGVVIRPLDIGVGILFIFWLIAKARRGEGVKPKQIFNPALLFAASGALSMLVNCPHLSVGQFLISLMYLLRWIAYMGIFFIVWGFTNNFKEKISKLLSLVGFVIVILGYVQYFFYSNLKNLFYLGWDEHMHRMFSVFLDPNFAGIFFVLYFIFLTSRFLRRRNVLIGLFMLSTLGAVFLTFSRSALITLIVSTSTLFILMNRKKLIMLLFAIILIVLLISSRYFNIENINLFRTASSQARLETADNAITIIKNNPIFGIGFNAYRYAQLNYGFRNINLEMVSHADAGADNSLLFVMATTGLVGLVLYIYLWVSILKNNFVSNPLIAASIIGAFVSSLFVNSLFYPFIMMWLWVVLALSIKNHN
jgi:O-antigen ligase